jgi:uncharacterized membrane protein YdbT with pleckstrin-like domain
MSGQTGPEEEKQERVILVLRRSRKAFLVEYSCGILLLVLLLILYARDIALQPLVRNVVLGLALLALVTPEISRLFLVYKITSTKVTIIKGILQQVKKNVHFIPLGYIPEINMKQDRIQRLLKYGTIFVHGSGQNSFEIKDVDQPQAILELIEDLIEKNRRIVLGKGEE